MLKVPDALPISVVATELRTAFWAAGIAIETPAPAMIIGATSATKIGTSELDPFRSSILGPWSPL